MQVNWSDADYNYISLIEDFYTRFYAVDYCSVIFPLVQFKKKRENNFVFPLTSS